MPSEFIHIEIEQDGAERPVRFRVQFSHMPIYFMFRTYDALGPRPIKMNELERQACDDMGRFLFKEIRRAMKRPEERIIEQEQKADE